MRFQMKNCWNMQLLQNVLLPTRSVRVFRKHMENQLTETESQILRKSAVTGVTAKVDGISVAAGNAKLMKRLGISYQECHHVGTVIHMAVDGKYEGHILIF